MLRLNRSDNKAIVRSAVRRAKRPYYPAQATWRGIGAGTGPPAAGVIVLVLPCLAVYGGAALLLGAASLWLLRLGSSSVPT